MEKDQQFGSFKRIKERAYNRIQNKRQERIVNCFDEEFTFIRKFDEYKFNRKMTDLNITHLVLNDEYDLTHVLEADIVNPIREGSNITFGLIGPTGTGKSENATKIALHSKEINKKYMKRDTSGDYGFELCWDRNDFEEVLKILKDGDIILKDEMPKHMGKGRLTQQWAIDNILNTIRLMENTFIFVDPFNINMPCNIYLESAGMDKKTRTNRVMVLDIDKNNKEHYYGHAYIRLHDNEELRNWYEREKRKFIKRNLELGGRHKVDNVIDAEFKEGKDEELQEDLKFLKLEGVSSKKYLIFKLLREKFSPEDIIEMLKYRKKKTITTARISQIKKEMEALLKREN